MNTQLIEALTTVLCLAEQNALDIKEFDNDDEIQKQASAQKEALILVNDWLEAQVEQPPATASSLIKQLLEDARNADILPCGLRSQMAIEDEAIYLVWNKYDVLLAAENTGHELTDDEALEILAEIEDQYDRRLGVTQDILEIAVDNYAAGA